ncbi:hypothetical protein R3P38DRAFT_2809851 [Favolaschia claudopus]|uniref:Uncharacterized protein n=1 Tax=Favolaschia claudopus TaxID=2862362 RepID=A0AAV9ZDE1_9AGAR
MGRRGGRTMVEGAAKFNLRLSANAAEADTHETRSRMELPALEAEHDIDKTEALTLLYGRRLRFQYVASPPPRQATGYSVARRDSFGMRDLTSTWGRLQLILSSIVTRLRTDQIPNALQRECRQVEGSWAVGVRLLTRETKTFRHVTQRDYEGLPAPEADAGYLGGVVACRKLAISHLECRSTRMPTHAPSVRPEAHQIWDYSDNTTSVRARREVTAQSGETIDVEAWLAEGRVGGGMPDDEIEVQTAAQQINIHFTPHWLLREAVLCGQLRNVIKEVWRNVLEGKTWTMRAQAFSPQGFVLEHDDLTAPISDSARPRFAIKHDWDSRHDGGGLEVEYPGNSRNTISTGVETISIGGTRLLARGCKGRSVLGGPVGLSGRGMRRGEEMRIDFADNKSKGHATSPPSARVPSRISRHGARFILVAPRRGCLALAGQGGSLRRAASYPALPQTGTSLVSQLIRQAL